MALLRNLSEYITSEPGQLSQYSNYAKGWITGDWTAGRFNSFSLLKNDQTCSGAHSASYSMDIWGPLSGVKGPDREADCSSPSSDEVKYEKFITPFPTCLHGLHRANCSFSFTFTSTSHYKQESVLKIAKS
jgi:hypothetical protein